MKTASFILAPGAVLVAVCLGTGGATQAGTWTAQQTVKAQVDPSCMVALTAQNTVLAFGSLDATLALMVTQSDATGSITVSCTSGVTYSVVAGDGNHYSSGWRMVNGSGQYLGYQLYSDATRSTAFARAGTSLSYQGFQNLTIYGRVPAQTVGGTGTFTDSVSFTLAY